MIGAPSLGMEMLKVCALERMAEGMRRMALGSLAERAERARRFCYRQQVSAIYIVPEY